MILRPIRNEEDHETALEEIEALWEAESGTPKADRLDVLVMLVEAYEAGHYPLSSIPRHRMSVPFDAMRKLDSTNQG